MIIIILTNDVDVRNYYRDILCKWILDKHARYSNQEPRKLASKEISGWLKINKYIYIYIYIYIEIISYMPVQHIKCGHGH